MWRTWLEHARIRAGARLMCSISTLASGALRGLTNYVVGEGYTHKAVWRKGKGQPDKLLLQAVQQVIDDFIRDQEWNLREREIFSCTRRDGESFWRFFPDEDEGVLRVRSILPEQVMEPAANIPYDRGSFGVLTEPEDLERPTGYWVCYDGDSGRPDDPDGVPADEISHIKVNVDRGVKRGLSDFSFDTYDSINSAQHLQENMTEGAAIQASLALIRQHDQSVQAEISGFASVGGGASPDLPNGTPDPYLWNRTAKYGPGRIEDIDKGWEYVPPPGATAGEAHVAVFSASLRSVAVRWNAPEWIISGDASNNNYSSSITAEAPFVRSCKAEQCVYKGPFNRTVRMAVRVAANAGRIVLQGRRWTWEDLKQVVDIETTPPSIEVRDKDKEAQGNRVRIDGGWKSPQQVAAEEGLDWDDVVRDRKEFAELQKKLNPQPAPGGPEPPALPDPTASIGESEIEQAVADALETLLEAGFTGTKQVTIRGKVQTWHYANGKRIAGPKKEIPVKPAKPVKASPEHTVKAIADLKTSGKHTREAVLSLLAHHTVDELKAIQKALGVKGGANKADRQGRIAGKDDKSTAKKKPVAKKPEVDLTKLSDDELENYARKHFGVGDGRKHNAARAEQERRAYAKRHAEREKELKPFRIRAEKLKKQATQGGWVRRHGMDEAEEIKQVKVGKILFEYNPQLEDNVLVNVARLEKQIASLPPKLANAVNFVTYSTQANKDDDYWAKEYDMPHFRAYATGGVGGTVVYRGNMLPLGIFAHEAGHCLANELWGSFKPDPDSEYGQAQAKEPPVNDYGSKAPSEDFAEACRYFTDPKLKEELKDKFPLKHAALEKIFHGAS